MRQGCGRAVGCVGLGHCRGLGASVLDQHPVLGEGGGTGASLSCLTGVTGQDESINNDCTP